MEEREENDVRREEKETMGKGLRQRKRNVRDVREMKRNADGERERAGKEREREREKKSEAERRRRRER